MSEHKLVPLKDLVVKDTHDPMDSDEIYSIIRYLSMNNREFGLRLREIDIYAGRTRESINGYCNGARPIPPAVSVAARILLIDIFFVPAFNAYETKYRSF